MQQLVERDVEQAGIADLLRDATQGSSGVLVVEGRAGVGKTRLLQGLIDLAHDKPVEVLQARGGEFEQTFPFGIAGQLLTAAVASLNLDRTSSDAARLAVELIDPRAPANTAAAGSGQALYARLHGLYWLCAELAAQRPLMLVIDDAHWADEPSLQWLLYMARRVQEMPLTLVLSARTGRWPEPLALLRDAPGVVVIAPQPLTAAASGVLIEHLLGEPADATFCGACHDATGGNPFLLVELVASVRADGLAPTAASAEQIRSLAPPAITRSVVVRLGQMSRAAAALARCIALLGAEAELRHAAKLAGLDLAAAAAAADALREAGFLDAGRTLRLVHPIVRTAFYAELPESERAQLHRRAADILADEDADGDAIAAHLLASEPAADRRAVTLLVKAAERALGRGASTTTVAYLRRALAEPPPPDQRARMLRRLGVVESQIGDPAAADHIDLARQLTPEREQLAELALELSVACLVAGRFDDAVGILEQAVSQAEDGDRELRWRLTAQLIGFAGIDPRHAGIAQRQLDRVPRNLQGRTTGERAILAELAWAALKRGSHVDTVGELARRAYGGGRLIAEQPPGSLSVQNALWTLVLTEQHELALSAYATLIEHARSEGWPIVFALMSSQRSVVHRLRGSIAEAIADAEAAISAGNRFGPSLVAPSVYGPLARALLEADDLPGAECALDNAGVGERIPPILPFLSLIDSRARLRLAQGNTQAGIDDLLDANRLLAGSGFTNPAGTHCRSTAAVALARLGRRDDARALVAEELADANAFGAGTTVGTSLRAAGVIDGGSSSIEYLREAVTQLETSPARLEHARALGDLGAALRRDGKRRDAQPVLREALDLADRCGAKAVAEQARAELVITGARPRRARISGVRALTASEHRVAQLAADGLTNRQIAQALFVSHPTVVTHLSHCYQKLSISSREHLADALAADPAD